MDSTGLAHRSKDTVLRWRRGQEERRMRGHSRLLALVRWRRGQKLLAPWGAGRAYAPDPRLGAGVLLRFGLGGGVLLGDAGFDGREVWEVVRGLGVWPLIRLRGGGEVRREVAARWDGEVYRRRGVVEGVFGGVKTRLRRGYLPKEASCGHVAGLYGVPRLWPADFAHPASSSGGLQGDLLGKPPLW